MHESTSYKHWRQDKDADNIVWLTIDVADKTVNVLSSEVLMELDSLLRELADLSPKGLIIQSGKDTGFIAGADISEFTSLKDSDQALELIQKGQTIFNRLEEFACPTLCLINGLCLGGGLELALACKYRIATDDPDTRLGLPEVMLGIHPGFGGTVRLSGLIGGPAAMAMMLTGRPVNSRRAKKIGLVDYVTPERQLKNAGSAVILERPRVYRPKLLQRLAGFALVRPILAYFMERQVSKRVSQVNYPAPFALIELWKKYACQPKKMMNAEATSVAELLAGSTAQNLVRVFFLQESLKSLGRGKDFAPEHVHVIGGGIMGGDIAAWCALQGFKVTIQDFDHEVLGRVVRRAHELFVKKLKQPHMVQAALDRIRPDVSGKSVSKADVVIEAIFENVEAKQQLFRDVAPSLKPGALLATNTSSIPLEILGEALDQPDRLVGLHFFNPVAKMQLVEIVHTDSTSEEAIEKALAFTRKIKRLPLQVKSGPGFLINRILMPYLLEAVLLELEGIPISSIDKSAVDFGMPMGPIELVDTVGLDICLSVADLLKASGESAAPDRLRELVAAGRKGRKTGQGFYTYKKGKPVKAKTAGDSQSMSKKSTDRFILRMLNEVVACLREKVVEDGDLLDAGMIFGTGFAPFRGGPVHYIKTVGHEEIVKRLKELQNEHGDRFEPDLGWETVFKA